MKKRLLISMAIVVAFGALHLTARTVERVAEEADATAEKDGMGRDDLRAFYTAPPVIPHLVTSRGSKECLTCHHRVREIGGRVTVKTPHAQFSNCQQCHVGVQSLNEDFAAQTVASSWLGLAEPKEGSRAHDYAPPTMPHRHFLREDCNSCHGPDNPDEALRGTHPERSNCMQCHVPDRAREF